MALVKASRIVNKALEFLGCEDNPIGSKRIVFNESYFENPDYGRPGPDLGNEFNWNIQFLWYVFKICDASELFYGGGKTTNPDDLLDYYTEHCQLFTSPKVGDLAVYRQDKVIGIVSNILTPYSFDVTIADVDWTSTVKTKIRNTEDLFIGFLRPDYLAEEPPSNVGGEKMIKFTKNSVIESKLEVPDYPLERGDQNKEVNKLRKILNYFQIKDNSGNELATTGKIGNSVVEAIENFQTEYELQVTGIYDEAMYNKVNEMLNK